MLFHQQNGQIVSNGGHPLEARNLTVYSMQSDSKSTRSVQSYREKRVEKEKEKDTCSVVYRDEPHRFQVGLH